MAGLWPGAGSEVGTASWRSAAPSLRSGQPGARQERASPAPRRVGRGGKERDVDRKGRAAPGGVTPGGESTRLPSPGRLCPSASPWAGAQGRGGHDAPLNLAQNKQPSAAGENSRPVFQADGETVEPFSSGPIPAGRHSSVNPLSPCGSGELVPGLLLASLVMGLLPFGWCFAEQRGLALPPGFLLLLSQPWVPLDAMD